MKIRHFNLQGARQLLSGRNKENSRLPGRRQFVKTLGLGAIAVNPSVGILKSLVDQPFTIEAGENFLRVYRHGLIAWEVTTSLFEEGATLGIHHTNEEWLFKLSGAVWPGTGISFDLQGHIYKSSGQWLLETKMGPDREATSVDFLDFLDRKESIRDHGDLHQELFAGNEGWSLELDGTIRRELDTRWHMLLSGDELITLHYGQLVFPVDTLILEPFNGNNLAFVHRVHPAGTRLTIPGFHHWDRLMATLQYGEKRPLSLGATQADLHIFTGYTSRQRPVGFLWGNSSGSLVTYSGFAGEAITLENLLFVAHPEGQGAPSFYAAATLAGKSQWITNGAGSFRLTGNGDLPDFEAFGYGSEIEEILFEPRMKAFLPSLEGVMTRPAVFRDTPKIFFEDQDPVRKTTVPLNRRITLPQGKTPPTQTQPVQTPQGQTQPGVTRPDQTPPTQTQTEQSREPEPQDPVRNTRITLPSKSRVTPQQDTVRKPSRNEPKVEVDFDKVRFRPGKALTIRIMRPEDLIWLDFEFHNFSFSNRGQAPFLELSNSREQGIIVVKFPTQHTLEQSFFETTPMDESGGNETITLPAKHIRAHRSRLVYELEAGHPGFELTLPSLLDWSKFKLRVHPRAWIKLPQITLAEPAPFGMATRTAPSPAQKRLPASGSSYGVKMMQTARNKASRKVVYEEQTLRDILPVDKNLSLAPNFDISKLKIDMEVGPVPELSTAIEAPALMFISPNQVNDFTHRIEVKFEDVKEARTTDQVVSTQLRILDPLATQVGEVTELWHTTLGIRTKESVISPFLLPRLKTIRALWAFDAKKDVKGCAEIDQPFQASLDASDRHKLVHTTSDYSIQGFTPIPVPVKKLMLTPLGAYLDWHAFFDVPTPADTYLNVIEWEHLATLGRDHYVKIVREGYLFPFGHRAALVKVTERKFNNEKKAAVNRTRMYIVVLQKEMLYERNDVKGNFIPFPFQAVRVENDSTPNIDKPENIPLTSSGGFKRVALPPPCPQKPGRSSTYNFYIRVGQKGFPFDLTVTDKEGNEHRIRMALAFVENVVGRTNASAQGMVNDYKDKTEYNQVPFAGQDVAYAECLVDGDTAFETESLQFGAMVYPATGEADLKFHPVMQKSEVFIKQVDELTGIHKPATIRLVDDNNEGYVFAGVEGATVDFTGGSDKSGGFAAPNMGITGLSKIQGPIGGKIEDMMDLNFNPNEFFKAMGSLPVAKIFGVIEIFSLLLDKPDLKSTMAPMINQVKAARQEIDKLKNEILQLQNQAKESGNNLESQIQQKKAAIKAQAEKMIQALNSQVPKVPNLKTWFTPEAFYAEYRWIPDFLGEKVDLFGGILGVRIKKPKEALQITTTFKKPFDGTIPSTLNTNARFSDFGVTVASSLAVNFSYMNFGSGSGSKSDIKVEMDAARPIEFIGPLSFVNTLQNCIPKTGFSEDGPYINLSLAGIKAGFDLSIPDVAVGIFMMSNITLGAYVNLPFNGDEMTIGFFFCKRENPFILTVSCFGGGGYFMLVTTLKGLKSVEAAFEFGAAVSINLGVASGGVSIMGGFYFKFEVVSPTEEKIYLTGYLRINGNLSVLGIITVSLEFYLALEAVIVDKTNSAGEKVKKVEKMEGVAILKVKIEVLFFKKTVSVTARRQFAGADADPTFGDMIELPDWQEYCLAFAS